MQCTHRVVSTGGDRDIDCCSLQKARLPPQWYVNATLVIINNTHRLNFIDNSSCLCCALNFILVTVPR